MRRRLHAVIAVLALCVGPSVFGASQAPASLEDRARGADHVARGKVVGVRAAFQENEFGDNLIVSTVQLAVDETMKGQPVASLAFQVEGGSVGDLTLRVSDQPVLASGDEGVFFLKRNRRGVLVPHLRAQGVVRLDRAGRVAGTDIGLDEVRQAVRSAQATAR